MKLTEQIMGMPVTIMYHDGAVKSSDIDNVFNFFKNVDQKYSPYIKISEVSRINKKELTVENYSQELQEILELAETTKKQTNGYFDVWYQGDFDPSGIVKGWAIQKAAEMLQVYTNDFYVEAGGDIQVHGKSETGKPWKIGVRNPIVRDENIAIVSLDNEAIATSGTAIRGNHIYNPVDEHMDETIISLSVISKRIIDADRMATAAFAMGKNGIQFIESLDGFEGYVVDKNKVATQTTNWHQYEEAAK
jgi:FAD:protein FMN transferase